LNPKAQAVAPNLKVQGVEAIKATLQKAAIHRDHRDRRRIALFAAIRPAKPNRPITLALAVLGPCSLGLLKYALLT
jgi:hypothetical protein